MSSETDIIKWRAFAGHLLVFWCVAAVLFLAGPIKVGFLSDDYDLILTAGKTPWRYAMEAHHWTPFVTAMFKATHAGIIGRNAWLTAAFLAHCANVMLVWAILTRRLRIFTLETWLVTLLFTVNCAGFEALAWSCAIGYVMTTTVVLVGFVLVLPLDRPFAAWTPYALAVLQVIGFLLWDWAILFSPLMALCFALSVRSPRDISSMFGHGLAVLWPSFGCWLLFVFMKTVMGQEPGYPVSFNAVRSTYFLLTGPLRCVYPNGSLAFFKSFIGLSAAACLWLFLGLLSFRNCKIRATFAMFVLCQFPYVLLGAPESRYFYLSCGFLYTTIILSIFQLCRHRIALFFAVVFIALNTVWALQRAFLWQAAYREAQGLKDAIHSHMQDSSTPLVVVNMPDRYGPDDMMWKPYVWRNGMSAFHGHIDRVNTPGSGLSWADSGIPVMKREEIRREYSNVDVLEVRYEEPGDWKHYVVDNFDLYDATHHKQNKGEQEPERDK